MRILPSSAIAAVAALLALAASPCHASEAPANSAVEFAGCVESIGVGLVSTASAQALLPAGFQLVGEGQPVTPLVARTSRCDDITVDGERTKGGAIVQIGVVIVPPQPGAFIDTYALWYYTSDAKLAHSLQKAGMNAQHAPNMEYDYAAAQAATQPLSVTVRKPGDPTLSLTGTVMPSPDPAGFFIANWWNLGTNGLVKMTTNVPSIFIGNANLLLRTEPDGELAQLLGGPSAGFAVLQQFNHFAAAHMDVSTIVP
jgi:hypothetical protein